MWFVATLFIIMLSYPLLKYMITGHFKIAVLIIGSVVLNLFFPPDIFLLCLSNVAYMFLFFCLGILFCKFDIQRFLSHSGSLLLSLLLFIALNLIPDCPILLLNLTGIIFSVSLCLNLIPDSIGTILLLPRLYVSNFSIRNFSANSPSEYSTPRFHKTNCPIGVSISLVFY